MCLKRTTLILSALVAVVMAITLTWASINENMFKIPDVVLNDPWFITSIIDVYAGIALFYAWVFYKESSMVSRLVWLIIFVTMGNLATAIYLLKIALKLPSEPTAADVLLRDEHHA